MSCAGTWENEYRSTMTLAAEGTMLFGLYRSHTGSTGTYLVVGCAAEAPADSGTGQPIALALNWHSLDPGEGDPSWHWCSGLSGQLLIIDGEPTLRLAHALAGAVDFPGVCPAGTYIDKLTYRRVAAAAPAEPATEKMAVPADPATGRWIAEDGSLLELTIWRHGDAGLVTGSLRKDGRQAPVRGVTDIAARDRGLEHQSIALATADDTATALIGTIDLATRLCTLTTLTSHATTAAGSYVQTGVSATTFRSIQDAP
ncbi:avidin/streptavidin family protein [Flavisphingomonas formosensis]|uniref:avidin/streptavidin family protein n=1 Tax=Flavisphingomonas formosensis TaxID=861534 RepID=UPI0018DF65A3|nr:avidin/streptavidin family protein [Sphingomonas formosensis]